MAWIKHPRADGDAFFVFTSRGDFTVRRSVTGGRRNVVLCQRRGSSANDQCGANNEKPSAQFCANPPTPRVPKPYATHPQVLPSKFSSKRVDKLSEITGFLDMIKAIDFGGTLKKGVE